MASFFAFQGSPERVPSRSEFETFLARPRKDGRARSPAGWNQELAALRAFVKFAHRDLGWTENPTDGIPFAREAAHDPAVLGVAEVRRLFTTSAETARASEQARDLALLAVLAQAALRVHELVALNLEQFDIGSATLVAVHGKGDTVHDLPLNGPTVALLVAYLATRRELAKPGERALFVSCRGTRLSIRTVQRLLERLRAALKTAKHVTPHTLRHSAATIALTQGSDISTVAEVLRHSDLNTTRRYLHLVDERRREAVRRLGAAIPEGLVAKADVAATAPAPGAEILSAAAPALPQNDVAAASPPAPRVSSVPAEMSPPLPGFLDVQNGLGAMDEAA